MSEHDKNCNHSQLNELADKIISTTPDVVRVFVPEDGDEQQRQFLSGAIANPSHTYERLAEYDVAARQNAVSDLHSQLLAHPETSAKYVETYNESQEYNAKQLKLIELARSLHEAQPEDKKQELAAEFMRLNIELYGEPDKMTYLALVQEDKEKLLALSLEGTAASLRDELMGLLPESSNSAERFKPDNETVEWAALVAQALYGNLIKHVVDTEHQYSPAEVKDIFETILREEFGNAAEGWQVTIEKAASIGVKRMEKKIVIPEDRKPIPTEQLKGLIAHELGVHMLRTIMGAETDMPFMAAGLPKYHIVEEGLGKVMEQAVRGNYEDSGIPYYLITSMMYFENKDFRAIHEVMWRRSALLKLKSGENLTDEVIDTAKKNAYKSIYRITRGTDTLPWFKDLAYYNGSELAWKYMENHRGDVAAITMALMGKTDLNNPSQLRVLLETRTR